MNVPQLCAACTQALMAGQNITLSLPKGYRWPNKFPRGQLLSVGTDGSRNVSFDPLRVLAWVAAGNQGDAGYSRWIHAERQHTGWRGPWGLTQR